MRCQTPWNGSVDSQSVPDDLLKQGLAVDAEESSGFLAPSLGAAQDKLDVALFQFFQGKYFLGKHPEFSLSLSDEGGKVFRLNHVAIFEDDDALDGVFQFPDVTGP